MNNKTDRNLINTLREQYHILVTIRDDIYDGEDYKYLVENVKDVRIETTVFHLLSYLLETKKGNLSHLQKVELIDHKKHLSFDVHTKKNLELVETLRNRDRTYSLLWLLDKNKNSYGWKIFKSKY